MGRLGPISSFLLNCNGLTCEETHLKWTDLNLFKRLRYFWFFYSVGQKLVHKQFNDFRKNPSRNCSIIIGQHITNFWCSIKKSMNSCHEVLKCACWQSLELTSRLVKDQCCLKSQSFTAILFLLRERSSEVWKFLFFFWGGTSQIFMFKRFWPYFFTDWMVYFSYMIR